MMAQSHSPPLHFIAEMGGRERNKIRPFPFLSSMTQSSLWDRDFLIKSHPAEMYLDSMPSASILSLLCHSFTKQSFASDAVSFAVNPSFSLFASSMVHQTPQEEGRMSCRPVRITSKFSCISTVKGIFFEWQRGSEGMAENVCWFWQGQSSEWVTLTAVRQTNGK